MLGASSAFPGPHDPEVIPDVFFFFLIAGHWHSQFI
jgi:hypothetical protein